MLRLGTERHLRFALALLCRQPDVDVLALFRGAGESEGRTSWTAKPEIGDYVSFYGFMVYYLHGLIVNYAYTEQSSAARESPDDERQKPKLILAGYSYGSMLASYLPPLESVLEVFSSTAQKPVTREIILAANQLSRQSSANSSMKKTALVHMNVPDVVCPSVSHILISPILPPVSFFTALSLLTSGSSPDLVLQGAEIKSAKPVDNLTAHRSLAIYGDDDSFTSIRKLRKWSAELVGAENSRFEYREVNGAGHFWQDERAESQMRRTIREWLSAVK